MEAGDPEKRFYQGILQISVALYHLGNQNWRGAVILLGEGISRLRYYQPSYAGIAVEDWLMLFRNSFFQQFENEAENALAETVELLRPSLCDALGNWTADYVRLRVEAVKP